MPWRCALCLGGTQNTQSKADTSSFTIEELQHNSFPLFLFSQTIVTMSKIFSAKVHVWVGVAWSNLGRGPPLLCSSFPAITPRWLPSTHQHMHEIWRLAKDVFPVGWLLSPPPVQRRCFEFQVVGLVYGELGTLSGKGVGEQRSPVLDPLLPKLPPTRAQLGKTKTLCRDVHQRQKGEKSNHREEVFCTLCWFWGSVGKRRKPGQGRAPPPPPAGKIDAKQKDLQLLDTYNHPNW